MNKKNVICVLIMLAGGQLFASNKNIKEFSFDAKGIKELELEAVVSNIRVIGTNDKKAYVKATINKQDEKKCTFEIKKSGKYLIVDVDWKGKNKSITINTDSDKKSSKRDGGDECDIDFLVKLPMNSDIEIKSITGQTVIENIKGDIEINKVEGDTNISGKGGEVEINVASSETKLTGEFSEIQMKSASGDIYIDGVCPDTTLNLASGDTVVKFQKIMPKGELKIRAISGETKIFLPKGMKFESDYVSISGDMKNYIGDTKKADFEIHVKTISGGLTIDKL